MRFWAVYHAIAYVLSRWAGKRKPPKIISQHRDLTEARAVMSRINDQMDRAQIRIAKNRRAERSRVYIQHVEANDEDDKR